METSDDFGEQFLDYTDCWLCTEMKKHYIKLATFSSIWQSSGALKLVRCPTHTALAIETEVAHVVAGQPMPHPMHTEIDSLGLSLKARNALVRNRIYTIGHLATFSESDLVQQLRGVGVGMAAEIYAAVHKIARI